MTALTSSETCAPEGRERAGKPVQVAGQHYWITRKRLRGVVLCKWCGLTRGPAAKARRCEPLSTSRQNEGVGR